MTTILDDTPSQEGREAAEAALEAAGYKGTLEEKWAAHKANQEQQRNSEERARLSREKTEGTIRRLLNGSEEMVEAEVEKRRNAQQQALQYRQQEAEADKQVRDLIPGEAENKLYWDYWKSKNPQLRDHPEVRARIQEDKKKLGPLYANESELAKERFNQRIKNQ